MDGKDLKRFDRIVALLIQLQSKKVVTAVEMAERFEVSLRTIYRDLRSLQEAGVPLYGETGRGYSLVEGYRLPPVMFSLKEAYSFVAAEKLIGKFADPGMTDSFKSAVFKIKSVLRETEKNQIAKLENHVAVIESEKPDENKVPDALGLIFESLTARVQLSLSYQSLQADKPVLRTIEPVGIFHENQSWYVMAYCHLRNDYRQFRTDRMYSLALNGKSFELSHGPLDEYRKKQPHETDKTEVTIVVAKKVAPYLKYERNFYGFVSEEDRCDYVEMYFRTPYIEQGIARWLLSFTDHIKYVEPEELRIRIKDLALKIWHAT